MQEAISPRERLAATTVNEKCRLGSLVDRHAVLYDTLSKK